MASVVDRLKVYINSSSPIVVIETLEEPRALEVVRAAASDLNMGLFEWSIADGLARTDGTFSKLRLTSENAASQPPINNTQPAAGVLAHMMTLTVTLTDTAVTLGPVQLTLGQEPQMGPCPICRKPERARS